MTKRIKPVYTFAQNDDLHKYLVSKVEELEVRWNRSIPMQNTLIREILLGIDSYEISVVKDKKK